jgi:tetratricopeptide (TPR) repeat protein
MATKVANSNPSPQHDAASAPHKKPRTLAGVAVIPADENRKKTLALYENALRLMQAGKYEKAHAIFNEMLANAPHDLADRIRMYIAACVAQISNGLALLASMTGENQKCIEHLTEAIRLNAQNRIQARSDSDFDGVADDPRFTELLYPEA